MDSPPSPAHHQRHWPLDLPSGLPFERYEHRRLVARDILVHRIMTVLFSPANHTSSDRPVPVRAPSLGAALAAPRQPPSPMPVPYHNFAGLKVVDRALARDVEVLRKMLVTRLASELIQQDLVTPGRPLVAWPGVWPPVKPPRECHSELPRMENMPLVEDEVLDLVRMHYLEVDDPATRLWLGMVGAPRRSGYQTMQKMTAKQGSHKELVQKMVAWSEHNQAQDYKRWYPQDSAHLKALQSQTRVANERPLYQGGAFLPRLQQTVMRSKASRAKFLNNMMEAKNQSCFADDRDGNQVQHEVFPWPEFGVSRRVLHAPSMFSWTQKQFFFKGEMPPVDFASGRTGRGLDRDGIWSTGRWYGDDVPRGRMTRRRRRRAVSEPPPGTFTAARLPVSFNSTRELVIFPKMTLSTMERRSRRRSLSRTRIAEMFSWDISLEKPPPEPRVQARYENLLAPTPKYQVECPDPVIAAQESMTKENHDALWRKLFDMPIQDQLSFDIVTIEQSSCAATRINDCGTYSYLKGMANVEGNEHWDLSGGLVENGDVESRPFRPNPTSPSPATPCTNCTTIHRLEWCYYSCGYCGAPNPRQDYRYLDVRAKLYLYPSDDDDKYAPKAGRHNNPHLAPNCPVARQNRCKCMPFPQYHTADKCLVLCSQLCGNTAHAPGHFKHKNAMSCKSRCCMCGMRGHSGMNCKLKTCRCGGEHLGQDCSWHPTCRVDGCDRFHCGVHCRACGLDRKGAGVMLLGGFCPACVEGNAPFSVEQGKSKRKNRRSSRSDPKKAKEEKTWYAPLEPRTRPVVGVKSGKSAAKRGGMKGEAEVRIGGCR